MQVSIAPMVVVNSLIMFIGLKQIIRPVPPGYLIPLNNSNYQRTASATKPLQNTPTPLFIGMFWEHCYWAAGFHQRYKSDAEKETLIHMWHFKAYSDRNHEFLIKSHFPQHRHSALIVGRVFEIFPLQRWSRQNKTMHIKGHTVLHNIYGPLSGWISSFLDDLNKGIK